MNAGAGGEWNEVEWGRTRAYQEGRGGGEGEKQTISEKINNGRKEREYIYIYI